MGKHFAVLLLPLPSLIVLNTRNSPPRLFNFDYYCSKGFPLGRKMGRYCQSIISHYLSDKAHFDPCWLWSIGSLTWPLLDLFSLDLNKWQILQYFPSGFFLCSQFLNPLLKIEMPFAVSTFLLTLGCSAALMIWII